VSCVYFSFLGGGFLVVFLGACGSSLSFRDTGDWADLCVGGR